MAGLAPGLCAGAGGVASAAAEIASAISEDPPFFKEKREGCPPHGTGGCGGTTLALGKCNEPDVGKPLECPGSQQADYPGEEIAVWGSDWPPAASSRPAAPVSNSPTAPSVSR